MAEGQQAAVDTHAGKYVATVLKRLDDSCEGERWQVQYEDGGYKEVVPGSKLSHFNDTDKEWQLKEYSWTSAGQLVATGRCEWLEKRKCVRVPFTSTKQAGVEMCTICAGGQLGRALAAAVVTGSSSLHTRVRSGNASGMREEWCPELGRGGDVVDMWMEEGLREAMRMELPSTEVGLGTTDGSQIGQRGTYGWILIGGGRCQCSSGKVLSKTRDMDSYRTELHGLMSLMAGAWRMKKFRLIKAKCDNKSVVDGYEKIRKWEKGGGAGEFPKFNHSVDLWEEVRYWSGLWDGAFQLEWHKGHPERRDPTRLSWCINDWMNHVADRVAAAEYGRSGGDDSPECLRHQRRWRLMYEGDRVTSMTLDALDNIQTAMMTEPMAKEQGIDMDKWDLRATKEVTGYDRVVSLRVMNVRTAWDRGSLRANKVYWRTERSRGGRRTMGHLKAEKKAWCKMCADGEVEDARHYMCRCPNDLYGKIRTVWYLKVKEKLRGMSIKLWDVFVGTVVLKNGMLANGEGQGADGLLTAWDATSGRIPILWTKTAAEEGIDDEAYKRFLRWYGERLRKDLWRPMWVERSREMASMKNDEIS